MVKHPSESIVDKIVDKSVISRFAPSPTGQLHLGHALSAVRAHDLAHSAEGRFLLRIEDIDGTRSRPEHVECIFEDLRWLGLAWDGPVWFQSERLDVYEAALADLRARRLLYPCFCTRAEIAREIAASSSAPHSGPDGPIYPGTCRDLSLREQQARISRGAPHAWRLNIHSALEAVNAPLMWLDALAGRVTADPSRFGDVVLARKDAPASYHLAVTIDDAAQGVTDVVRGRDLFDATDVHRLLQALLTLPTPTYHHHPLIVTTAGKRLAKRHGAPSLVNWRASGLSGVDLAEGIRRGQLPLGFSFAKE